jgi:hypothetical protein
MWLLIRTSLSTESYTLKGTVQVYIYTGMLSSGLRETVTAGHLENDASIGTCPRLSHSLFSGHCIPQAIHLHVHVLKVPACNMLSYLDNSN